MPSEKTFRQILEEAESSIDIYKYPDIDEAREMLNEALKAAGDGYPDYDEITSLRIYHDGVHVRTRYSVRSCEQTGKFFLPNEVIDSPYPVISAKIWGLRNKRDAALAKLKWDQKTLEASKKRFDDAESALFKEIGGIDGKEKSCL